MKDTIKTRLEAVPITSLTKSFYRRRIPKYTSKRKENVDIEILVTSRMVTGKSFNPSDE